MARASTSRSWSTTCASRGLNLPLLIRFSDILRTRVEQLCGSFQQAIAENDYKGAYRGVYPIKVNQQRHVVEELIEYGRPFNLGLEAGSKPELLVALALQDNPEALILCNGYKDRAYIETALLAQKLGRQVIIVMDRMGELETILAGRRASSTSARSSACARGSPPRARASGSSRPATARSSASPPPRSWPRSSGCARRACSTACSSCTSTSARRSRPSAPSRTRCARPAASSSSCTRSAPTCSYLDCGGGLGVDYDGSQTNFHSSVNYTLQEYAADIVSQIAEACNAQGRAASRHRHRVGPRAGRAPLGAGLQRARHATRCCVGQIPEPLGRGRAPRHPAALRDLRRRLAQELPGGVPRRAAAQGGGDHRLQPGRPRPQGARARRAALLRDAARRS